MPVPDGFYPQCCAETLTQDRTELAGTVANRVVCAWLDRFFTAPEGSTQAAEALDAIASIPSWPVTAEVAEAAANPVEGYIPTPRADPIPTLMQHPRHVRRGCCISPLTDFGGLRGIVTAGGSN